MASETIPLDPQPGEVYYEKVTGSEARRWYGTEEMWVQKRVPLPGEEPKPTARPKHGASRGQVMRTEAR